MGCGKLSEYAIRLGTVVRLDSTYYEKFMDQKGHTAQHIRNNIIIIIFRAPALK